MGEVERPLELGPCGLSVHSSDSSGSAGRTSIPLGGPLLPSAPALAGPLSPRLTTRLGGRLLGAASPRRTLRRGAVRRGVHRRQRRRHRLQAECLVDLALDLSGDPGVLAQVALDVVAPLAEPLVAVGEERA